MPFTGKDKAFKYWTDFLAVSTSADKILKFQLWIGKKWTAIDRYTIIWESNLKHKMWIIVSFNRVSTIV